MYYDSSTGDLKCQAIAVDNASVTGTLPVSHGGTGATSTSQNYVFAGPTSGSGAPTFRQLTAGDLPASASYWSSATGGINYSGGNVGVGSSSPAAALDINGQANAKQFRALQGTPTGDVSQVGYSFGAALRITRGASAGQHINFVRAGNNATSLGYLPGTAKFGFGLAATTDANFTPSLLAIDTAAGYVGIGTTAPSVPLSVYSAAGQGRLSLADANGSWTLWGGANLSFYQNAASSTAALFLQSGGNVGLGTTAPTAPLHLYSAGSTSSLWESTGGNVYATLKSAAAAGENFLNFWNTGLPAGSQFWRIGQRTTSSGLTVERLTDTGAAVATTAMVINPAGNVITPNQTFFESKLCSTTVNSGATAGIVWETVVKNIGGGYNATNGFFTAPVAGVYSFGFNVLAPYAGTGEYRLAFAVNGAAVNTIIRTKASSAWETVQGTMTTYLNAGDTMNIQYVVGSGALYTDCNYNRFWGRLGG